MMHRAIQNAASRAQQPDEGVASSAAAAAAAAAETGEPSAESEAFTVQHVLLPALRKSYEPPSAQATDGTVVQVACTEMLYKIFERC